MRTLVGSFGGVGVAIFFFLSGYGSYLSFNKKSNSGVVFRTVTLQIYRLVLVFMASFAMVFVIRVVLEYIFHMASVPIKDAIFAFLSLQMIGTSTW